MQLLSVLLCRAEYDLSQHKWLSDVFIGVNEAVKYETRQLQADQPETWGRKLWAAEIALDKVMFAVLVGPRKASADLRNTTLTHLL